MRIVIGSDHFGYQLKEDLKTYLRELGHDPVDLGCQDPNEPVDYPDVAIAVSQEIARGEFSRGILICGTGIGMAMVANKIPGVRAAVCHDPYSAERARKSNDAQVMAMGSQVIGSMLGRQLIDHWLASEFAGGRSQAKVDKIKKLDQVQKGG